MPWGEGVVSILFTAVSRNFFVRELVVFLAELAPYLVGVWFLVLLRSVRDRRRGLFIFFLALLAITLSRGIITSSIHYVFDHPRPFQVMDMKPLVDASGSSFPSGHAAIFFALAAIAFLLGPRIGLWFSVFAIVNGIARIAVGVHYPLDIVGGAFVGVVSGVVVRVLFRREEHALRVAEKSE